ncbi:MAG: sigma-54-dependent Fis family transcriptional regulator [Myxococcota bacterium]
MESTRLDRLLDLTWRLSEEHDLETCLQMVADHALELIPADHTDVLLLDASGEHLVSAAQSGVEGEARSGLDVAHRPAGWVRDTGRSARVADLRNDDRSAGYDPGFPAASLVAVPMLVGGAVVGVVSASSPDVDAFSRRDEGLLRLLANGATPHLDRARAWRIGVGARLEHELSSPLRLRLAAELLELGEVGLTLEDAVLRTGRYRQDVEACFSPMVRHGIVEFDGSRYRLSTTMPSDVRARLTAFVDEHADELRRERHVRHHLLGGMIGVDPKMQVVFELVRQVARIDVPVLIRGETGTGKELVARAIHDISPRRRAFFGAVNCATLTETLFESQVFGHARGAFTGAVSDYVGLVERCDGGTLFLDEVGDLSLANQVKLLRFLQEGTFTRLGDAAQRTSDYRLISATNRDLESMVAAGTFREDLYYRLAVFPIRVPSLRERKGDLKYLAEAILDLHAQRFMRGYGGAPSMTAAALAQLEKYHWPGNVRELENVMMRAMVMAGNEAVDTQHLPEVELLSDVPPDSHAPDDSGSFPVPETLEDVQREHIRRVLREQRGNIKATATVLGISRTTLYKKIRDMDIDAPL